MHRRLLLFIIGLSAMLSSSAAQLRPRVTDPTDSKPIVKELNLDGLKKLLTRDSKDAQPLLINFWATWCDACREEFPDLLRIQADYRKRGLMMIFVSLDDLTDINTTVPQFLREMHAEKLPHYLLNVPDPEPAIKIVDASWKGGLPATFLYDKQGAIVFKHMGRIKPLELRAALDKVVK
jgi:thiol-disulfide isomerase/thioredoxin